MPNKGLIAREIFGEVAAHLKEPEITVLTGARQVGKTVLLETLKNWLVQNKKVPLENISFFNLDLVKDREFLSDQTRFIEYLESISKKHRIYVFVDEAQKVPDCASFFKGVYDRRLPIKLVLSGSSSFELKTKLKESLAGRKKIFSLNSFSFFEFLDAQDPALATRIKRVNKISELERKSLINLYKEYLVWGGYPRVALTKNLARRTDILTDIYSSYIEKDIIGFMEIKNWIKFSRLVKLIAGQTGSLINIAELTNSANLDRDTVERYLKILQETYITQSLLPFYKNPRQEIIKLNKIYFHDTGLRNYALENYSPVTERPDGGFLLENAVFRQLRDSLGLFGKVRFWRTKQGAEVDFIVIEKEKVLLPVEVKLSLKKPAVSLGLRSFIEKYKVSKALVVSLTLSGKTLKIDRCHVLFIHPYELRKHV